MDKVFFCFVLFLCVTFNKDVFGKKHNRSGSKAGDGKIVGGYNTTIQQVPYQVYLIVQKGSEYYACGGSILSPKYVLTAAHCLTGVSMVYIRAGSTDSNSGGAMYSTSYYRQHPKYNARSSDYDVGVVRLIMQRIKIDGVNTKAVQLPEANTAIPTGTEMIVSGWGATSENGDTSRYLLAVRVPTVESSECDRAYNNAITSRMFCAGVPEGGKDSCQGDSGGPAVAEDTGLQMGIVSFGRGCAQAGYPGVYTNVSSVRDFIKSQTGL